MAPSTTTRDLILAYLEREASATSTELAGHLGVTRQAVNLHLRPLIDAGAVVKTGSTRNARYFLASALQECFSVAGEQSEVRIDEKMGKQNETLRLIWRQVGGSRTKHLPIDD